MIKNIRGDNNLISYARVSLNSVTFEIAGNNNTITIGDDCELHHVVFYLRGNNHHIEIGRHCKFNRSGHLWIEDDNGRLVIGDDTSFEDTHIAVTEPGSSVEIGRDCLFAYDIDIRTGDSHAILSSKTGKKINAAKNVSIGNHVWIAAHCIILKGVRIPDNCIVASGSVVTRNFDNAGVIIGGNPAKELKGDINWSRERFVGDANDG